jgi:hypothetical protein
MMNLWFVDDARQRTPFRQGMGPLVAVGGICVPEVHIKELECQLETICSKVGIVRTQEFKWSPGRELWMHGNLVNQARTAFFIEMFAAAKALGVMGIFVAADSSKGCATNATDTETDVVSMLLERIHNVTPGNELALVISDRPGGGGVPAADRFSARCLETIRSGTNILNDLKQISLVLTCGSALVRCLQLADVFTSCLAAYIAGETRFAPQLVPTISPTLRRSMDRIGGFGVKIHPDFNYANLYHWLFGDGDMWRNGVGRSLPLASRPYPKSADVY